MNRQFEACIIPHEGQAPVGYNQHLYVHMAMSATNPKVISGPLHVAGKTEEDIRQLVHVMIDKMMNIVYEERRKIEEVIQEFEL